jgi:23S rRNA (uracil1939-C5)-methyltransferase
VSRAAARPADPVELDIGALGHRGDGLAVHDGVRVFVPFALPGDRARVHLAERTRDGWRAEVLAWLRRAPRTEPPCPHFGACGGCRAQHLLAADYAAWRRDQIAGALAARGLTPASIDGPAVAPSHSRRRARLLFMPGPPPRLGYRARSSRRVVEPAVCPLLRPELEAMLAPLRTLLAELPLARHGCEVQLTALETGVDLLLLGRRGPTLADREQLAAFADARDLVRVAWADGERTQPESVVTRRPATLRFGRVAVELPPGAFLQATAEAEDRLQARVLAWTRGDVRVLDLFAGCGTFALPLAAAGRRVHAVERDPDMASACANAARAGGLAGRIEVETRDLERRPLAGAELTADTVVLDPPRAGAPAQTAAVAAGDVTRAVLVSCSPASFARDAAILVQAGFRLAELEIVDAFLWSDQIELVARLER